MIYPAAKVILFDPNIPDKLLLIFRNVVGAEGFEAAGGRVEVDFTNKTSENLEICAVREIKEEVGVDVKIHSYLGSYTFFWTFKADTCSCCAVFIGEIIGGTIGSNNPDLTEIGVEPQWVAIADILHDRIQIGDTHRSLKPILKDACKWLGCIFQPEVIG